MHLGIFLNGYHTTDIHSKYAEYSNNLFCFALFSLYYILVYFFVIQPVVILFCRGHLVMSGDSFECYNWAGAIVT